MKITMKCGNEVDLSKIEGMFLDLNTGELVDKESLRIESDIPRIEKSLRQMSDSFKLLGMQTEWSYCERDNSFTFGFNGGDYFTLVQGRVRDGSISEIQDVLIRSLTRGEFKKRIMSIEEIELRNLIKNRELQDGLNIDMTGGIWVNDDEVDNADYIKSLNINIDKPYSLVLLDEGVIMINNDDFSVEYYE